MSSITIKALVCALGLAPFLGVAGMIIAWKPARPGPAKPFLEVGGGSGTHDIFKVEPLDHIKRIDVMFSDSQRFGIICPRLRHPLNIEEPKRLTRDTRGHTNNTCFRIDGYEFLFGHQLPGVRWVHENGRTLKEVPMEGKARDRAWLSSMEVEESRVRVTQSVEIVVGEMTRLYDTALIKYRIQNRDKVKHTVGLRVMLDTFIGANDGVPFYLPPTEDLPARLVDKMEILRQKQIPDYLQALETSDLSDKNATLAILCPRIKGCEVPEKLVICRWPQNSEARWGTGTTGPGDWPYEPMDANSHARDSCVVMYWAQVVMNPGEQRVLAFSYGLGQISSDGESSDSFNGRLRLLAGNRNIINKPITVMAYVRSTDPQQTVTLKLPEGLTFLPGQPAQQAVPAAGPHGFAQVTWRVQAAKPAIYLVQADAPNIGSVSQRVIVGAQSLFE